MVNLSLYSKFAEKRRNGILYLFLYDRVRAALEKLGLSILLSIVFEYENLDPSSLKPIPEDYRVEVLGANDMPEVAAIDGFDYTHAALVERFANGANCFGLRHRGELVAFMWYNLTRKRLDIAPIELSETEAYTFDAYTSPVHRGKKLNALLKCHAYKELQRTGLTKFLSYTDYFNTPSIKSHRRLGCKPICLVLNIGLFGRFERSFTLKRYETHASYLMTKGLSDAEASIDAARR
jgi:hypothetical protein